MLNYDPIPKSESDLLLREWGYDLLEEYFTMISAAGFPQNGLILDIATGSGRAVSTLTRLGHSVITGDHSLDSKSECEKRITESYLNKVKFIQLNLKQIPFTDDAIVNVVCINTLHELDDPFLCLKEICRIHSTAGKLLIADFNAEGFDVMDKLHIIRERGLHPRCKISSEGIKKNLVEAYFNVEEINTKLNNGFIVSRKRNEK